MAEQQLSIGRRIHLPAHFAGPVGLESVRTFGAVAAFGRQAQTLTSVKPASTGSARPFVEAARIRLAHTHDRNFAASLSGLHTLQHQIEAIDRVLVQWPDSKWARGGACTDG